jgi:hypothetical protein
VAEEAVSKPPYVLSADEIAALFLPPAEPPEWTIERERMQQRDAEREALRTRPIETLAAKYPWVKP